MPRMSGLLDDLMARIAPCFARRETRLTCRDMVNGLLSELDDHNCWTLAEAAGHASPYRMQHLLSRARVDDRQLLDAAADWAATHITAGQDEGDVMLIVDETADEKSSADCAGAARQYSGTVGGIAMCQVAVTLTCASPAGHALIGRALYLPARLGPLTRSAASSPESPTRSCSPRSRSSPATSCSTPMTGASAPDSPSATRCTAALTCARASGNAAPATSWPSAPTTW